MVLLRRVGVTKVGEELCFLKMLRILSAEFLTFPALCQRNV